MIARFAFATLTALALLGGTGAGAETLTADQILIESDKVRNPGQPFRLLDTLVQYVSGKPNARLVLSVFAKTDTVTGQYRNVVHWDDPPRDVGKMLLKNGEILWFYDPASKASVRLSAQQRLIGQASNGDVVTVNLAKDYKAKLVGEESIQDADHKDRACWHLDLAAANDDATYNRVELWVEKETYYPVKSKFYADSGRLLKIAYFRKLEQVLGRLRPTETIIIDAVDSSQVTTQNFADYRAQDIPESWFQRDYLARLKVD